MEKETPDVDGLEDGRVILVQLTDMFGDVFTSSDILSCCIHNNWHLESCIEYLIKLGGKDEKRIIDDNSLFNVESDNVYKKKLFTHGELEMQSQTAVDLKLNADASNKSLGAIPKSSTSPKIGRKELSRVGIIKTGKTCAGPIRQAISTSKSNRSEINDFELLNAINSRFKVLVIMRGAPGCGKSHLAKKIVDATVKGDYQNHIFSTDDYFYNVHNHFVLQPDKLSIAHEANQMRVKNQAAAGWSPIIVDNTNIKIWEMLPYVNTAVKFGYIIKIVEPNSYWSQNPGELAKKNLHGVPKDKIQRMLINFEKISVEELLKLNKKSYQVDIPQLRLKPDVLINSMEAVSSELTNKTSINATSNTNEIPSLTEKRSEHSVIAKTNEKFFSGGEKSDQIASLNINNFKDTWLNYDEESKEYWKNGHFDAVYVSTPENIPKPQRVLTKTPDEKKIKEGVNMEPNTILKLSESSNKLEKHMIGCDNENKLFVMLRQIYPNKVTDGLWDLFEKCQGNIDWAIEILLKDDSCIDQSFDKGELKSFECNCGISNSSLESTIEQSDSKNIENLNLPRSRKRERVNRTAQGLNEMKKALEIQFVLNDKYYSNHVKKLKNLRHAYDSEMNSKFVNKRQAANTEIPYVEDDISSDADNEEMVEIILGDMLTDQLANIFEMDLTPKDMIKDLKTNIYIPKSLAHQLYLLWVESIYNQLDEQKQQDIQEDEEFARLLAAQQKYNKCIDSQGISKNLLTYLYNSEHNSWKDPNQQDLASQLTKLKLCEAFPNVDKRELLETLVAHENKFTDTIEVLKSSLASQNVPKNENRNELQQEFEIFDSGIGDAKTLSADERKRLALNNFEISRNLSVHHSQLKAECYQKAKDAIQKGNTSVAVYYSQIANLHKRKIDAYNHTAANCIVAVHDLTQNNPDFIDLHYLHVAEAEQCLDIFIDSHVTKLKSRCKAYKYIFIITGRGLHSAGGISMIKNKVKSRLKERNLKWSEVNPGLLKVKIFSTSKYANHTNL